mgnify:CR=1 FL=1
MSTPVWTTTAGKLGAIEELASYSLQLEANTADSTAVTYSVIAGSLPPGLQLTSTGLLQGVPFEVATRTLYTFVVRATSGTTITDRTFSLDISGADAPTFTTATGRLQLDDSTRSGIYWVLDGSQVSYQIEATDTDTATGQTLVYEIVQGALPPGCSMNKTGLITGVVELTDDEKYGPIGGYAGLEAYDDVVYDRTVFSKSRSVNYDFIIRVSDGSSFLEQNNSIFVYTADYFRVDNDQITIDQTEEDGVPLLMSASPHRRPIFKTASDLGTFRHDNNVVIKIDVQDFDSLQSDLEYTITSGALPTGLNIDVNLGEIYGTLPKQSAIETTYTFTIRARRVITSTMMVYTDATFTMKVVGDIDIGITFTTPSALGTVTAGIPTLLYLEAVASETNRIISYEVTTGSLPDGITLSPSGYFIGTVDMSEFTSLDANTITFDTNSTSFDRSKTFTVTARDQYQTLATSKEFTLDISLPYGA